jgi:hypothetical protein
MPGLSNKIGRVRVRMSLLTEFGDARSNGQRRAALPRHAELF